MEKETGLPLPVLTPGELTHPEPQHEPELEPEVEIEKREAPSPTTSQDELDNQTKAEKAKETPAPTPTPTPGDQGHEYITGMRLWSVLLGITLVAFLMLLDVSIVSTAIPRITSDFHSLNDVGWYGSAYQLANASFQLMSGQFYTYCNSKWTFLSFFALFELGSLLCGVAQSSKALIVGRAVAGLGTSGIQNGALTIIAGCVPMEKRPLYMGLMMGICQIGIAIGPLIGGALTEYTTWRWCFYINLPVGGLVAALLFFTRVPDQTAKVEGRQVLPILWQKLDLIGFVLFAPAMIQLLLALQWGGNKFAWNSATIIGLFCGSGGTMMVFLLWEWHKGEKGMLPLSMIRHRLVWCCCLFGFFLFSTLLLMAFYLPIYFQSVKGATPAQSGVDVLPSILSQLFMTVTSGFLVGKLGYYLPWAVASGVIGSIASGLMSTLTPSTPTAKWIGYQILLGAGRGAGMQMSLVALQNFLPHKQISTGMALIMFCQTLGGAISLSVADTILTNSLKSTIPQYAPNVNPQTVIEAGATAVRSVVSEADLPGVLMAYAKSVDNVFYLVVGMSAASFVFAWGIGWKDIRKKKEVGKA